VGANNFTNYSCPKQIPLIVKELVAALRGITLHDYFVGLQMYVENAKLAAAKEEVELAKKMCNF
jgi:hypothetical protein